MKVQHIQYPFHHTVVYEIFDQQELALLKAEARRLELDKPPMAGDPHHKKLREESNAVSYCLDDVYAFDRTLSPSLNLTTNLFDMAKQGVFDNALNPFLNYIPLCNLDRTYMQLYGNHSSYFMHEDAAVLTALYPLHLEEFSGGALEFVRYGYAPFIPDNSCLIFPSYEPHQLLPVDTKHPGAARASINKRLYIR